MPEKYSHAVPGGRGYWWTEKLWAASSSLPRKRVRIDAIAEFDRDCWFQGKPVPTVREVAEHARRIGAADLSHPVILASDGRLMDGAHRIAKAYLAGHLEVVAVQFEMDPPPDWVVETQ
jgi:hypothetical protein